MDTPSQRSRTLHRFTYYLSVHDLPLTCPFYRLLTHSSLSLHGIEGDLPVECLQVWASVVVSENDRGVLKSIYAWAGSDFTVSSIPVVLLP